MISEKRIKKFQNDVWRFYRKHGRAFPWRNTRSSYRILVSEVMLQQTQVERVRVKYKEFIKTFPSFDILAAASTVDVLRIWQGLGYNRRALYLKRLAEIVVREHGGRLLRDVALLEKLPGVGAYTARAVAVFAWNEPHALVETNVRSVYLHTFFRRKENVPDRDILAYVDATLERARPREWYYALMDYGSTLKRHELHINKRSKHYTRQSKFKDSNREIRGTIIRPLLTGPKTLRELAALLPFARDRIEENLSALVRESLVKKTKSRFRIAGD